MNILLLTREYPPETTWGGCSIVNYNLATGLANRGYTVHVICQSLKGNYDVVEKGVHVHRVGSDVRAYSIISRLKYLYVSWRRFKKLKKQIDFDIIQSDHWSAEGFICLGYKKAKKVIKTQNLGPGSLLTAKNYRSFKEKLGFLGLSMMASLILRNADCFICESEIDYYNVVHSLNLPPKKVKLVYNGIDTNLFKPSAVEFRETLEVSQTEKLIITVGRLERKKGIDVIIGAIPNVLKKAPDTKFLFIGRDSETSPAGGSFKDWMADRAKDGGFTKNLIIKGFLTPTDLPNYYSASDIFVLASREESFALVIAEAMACGLPVISTPVGIAPEISKQIKSGFDIVKIEDPNELAHTILKSLELSKNEIEEIKKRNRSFIEKIFSLNSWIENMISVYSTVVNKSKRGI